MVLSWQIPATSLMKGRLMAKILIFEDGEKHRGDAKRVLEAAGHVVVFETSLDNLWRYKPSKEYDRTSDTYVPAPAEVQVDGVITDIHFPYRGYKERGTSQDYTDANCPTGLSVAIQCDKLGIPFVLCTDGYHHGNKLQWIHELVGVVGWDMAEGVYDKSVSDGYTQSYPSKDWAGALDKLMKRIEAKSAS